MFFNNTSQSLEVRIRKPETRIDEEYTFPSELLHVFTIDVRQTKSQTDNKLLSSLTLETVAYIN